MESLDRNTTCVWVHYPAWCPPDRQKEIRSFVLQEVSLHFPNDKVQITCETTSQDGTTSANIALLVFRYDTAGLASRRESVEATIREELLRKIDENLGITVELQLLPDVFASQSLLGQRYE